MKILIALLFLGVTNSVPTDQVLQPLVTSTQIATGKIYKGLAIETTGNFVFSPFSILSVLTSALQGSFGATASQIADCFNLSTNHDTLQQAVTKQFKSLKGTEDQELLYLNKIYVNKNININQDYKAILNSAYHGDIENVDFDQKAETVAKVNDYYSDQTHQTVQDVVTPDYFVDPIGSVWTHTFFFSSKWQNQFSTYGTCNRVFHCSERDSMQCNMMYIRDTFKFFVSDALDAKFLQIDYVHQGYSMVIVLPNKICGIKTLEEQAELVFGDHDFSYRQVDLVMPKFSTEFRVEFHILLKKFGIVDAFSPNANFSGICSGDQNIYINKLTQQAHINIDEFGTYANATTGAVANGLTFISRSMDTMEDFSLIPFVVDHPFMYYILSHRTDTVLYAGRVMHP